MRTRVVLLLAVVAALLAVPAAASATLVYQTQSRSGTLTLWSANNDGSGAFRIGTGYFSPSISPDGQNVAVLRSTRSGTTTPVYVIPTAGGPAVKVLRSGGIAGVGWSPDSQTLATVTARNRLVTISLPTGAVRTVAEGFFNQSTISFSPAGDAIAFSVATSDRFNARSDVYTVPTAGGVPTRLTTDGLSLSPVWGPTQIAYSRGPHRRNDAPQLQIWLMNPDGSGQRKLTNVRVPRLVAGLGPFAWSASGEQLLAGFTGQDTNQAYAVDPLTGSARNLGAAPFDGTSPAAISRDGTTVLAQTGGQEGPSPGQNVVTIPYAGGAATILVRNAQSPDWNA
jgi:Tol biopolymer transport system component